MVFSANIIIIVVLICVAVAALFINTSGSGHSFSRKQDELIENRFRALVSIAADERYSFRGDSAIPVHDFQKGPTTETDMELLNRICKNSAGEYFHVILSQDSHYIKHMTSDRAALVLKEIN